MPESILDTENCLNWNGNMDYPNDHEEECAVDIEFDMEQEIGSEDPKSAEQRDVGASTNVPGLIRPTRKSKREAE